MIKYSYPYKPYITSKFMLL